MKIKNLSIKNSHVRVSFVLTTAICLFWVNYPQENLDLLMKDAKESIEILVVLDQLLKSMFPDEDH